MEFTQPLKELRHVNIVHSTCVADCPVNKACLIDRVCEAGLDKVIAIDLFPQPYDLTLMLRIAPHRHNRKAGIILTVIDHFAICRA